MDDVIRKVHQMISQKRCFVLKHSRPQNQNDFKGLIFYILFLIKGHKEDSEVDIKLNSEGLLI